MKTVYLAAAVGFSLLITACRNHQTNQSDALASTLPGQHEPTGPSTPDWAKNATIYEVNVRQFSPKGTFAAVEEHLPRLKELGADIIWLMPIYPIGTEKRLGRLGNPYAVANYTAVNPDFGTMADFKSLVRRAHDVGLRVIIDWVPDHTSWDHPWINEHPDWYVQKNGRIISPVTNEGKPTGWNDVAQLNYNNPDLRASMIKAMQFWVKEADVDGFRLEVAGMVPNDFWQEARAALDRLKPVFLLSEWDNDPAHFKWSNANYGWNLYHLLKDIAAGKRPAAAIDTLLNHNQRNYPAWYYQMHFIHTHDENSHRGTLQETFGPAADVFAVLTATLEGMPLIYNGMESNLNKQLSFYDKDTIPWDTYSKSRFFKTLFTLKHRNKALWNGLAGGQAIKIPTSQDDKAYAFYRRKDNDWITVILNLSDQPLTIRLNGEGYEGRYTEVFTRQPAELKPQMTVSLKPWGYQVYTN
ncbi:alpha-amylase family glycosyl hydrolase [Nibrella viscosa]|uniref:Alpha-amylase family glycosyl hydrolase n=1 Tax=Nibrella viscosa TaxID=1084524 RepID=A0ABP8L076_9BACT